MAIRFEAALKYASIKLKIHKNKIESYVSINYGTRFWEKGRPENNWSPRSTVAKEIAEYLGNPKYRYIPNRGRWHMK